MSWNYRIVRTMNPEWVWAQQNPDKVNDPSTYPRYQYGVHEAHYADGESQPHSWTTEPVAMFADDLDTLRSFLSQALTACDVKIVNDTGEDEP